MNFNGDTERTMVDYQNYTNNMVGKIFYELEPGNPNRFRTVRIAFRPIANRMVPEFTPYVEGVPPDGMTALPPHLLGALMRFQNPQHSFY